MPTDGTKNTEKISEMIKNEIQFLRDLNMCENIIELKEVYRKQSTKELQLVLKFAEYGCLRDYIINFGSALEEK